MSKGKGKKRRQRGEGTHPRHRPPPPGPPLPPEKANRLAQAFVAYVLMAGICWLWGVEDVDDVPILRAATGWAVGLSWPQSESELWSGPPLIDR